VPNAMLGYITKKGHGVKVDKQYALEWFEKSAEQGHEKAKARTNLLNEEGYYIDDRQKSKCLYNIIPTSFLIKCL
jgi:TPR repeat protein